MKKVLPILGLLTIGASAFAQLPVSTTAADKNVVLEEFTGIHCTFCPDGHKRAQQLSDNNPGRVVLINIHTGGYATPNAGEPDFRTSFGSAIANQTGLTGYPSGTVNRRAFGGASTTALGRGDWAPNAPTVLGEASYVNIALEGDIDVATRVLTVDVEMYVTNATAPTDFNLNVALLQSNVEGPQTGMNANPAQVLPNGNYLHNHILRHLLTGQWGEVITSVQGSVITRQYTYTLPADINGVALELGDLSIAAFIAEGQQNIITGDHGSLTFTLPSGSNLVDLAATTNMQANPSFCDGSVIPEVTITNNETNAISTYEVSYSLNGGTAVTQTITTPLAGGASATHTFPVIVLPTGANTIEYNTAPINATDVELINGNNHVGSDKLLVLPSTAFDTQHTEGFESNTLGDESPAHSVANNPDDIPAFVVSNAISGSVSQALGGFGNSAKSFRWDFYNIQNGESSIVFEKLDLSTSTNHVLKFNHAYAQYVSENDKLKVNVSTDCGATWTNVFSKQGTALSTAPAVGNGRFYPSITQWEANSIDLSSYDGQSEVMVEFRGISAYGNNLFVDDIQILNQTTSSINDHSENAVINVYPNPSTGIVNLNITTENADAATITVINSIGEVVLTSNENLISGLNNRQLDLQNLVNGVYFVQVTIAGSTTVDKVTLLK